MAIYLASLQLPNNCVWQDEFSWGAVVAAHQVSLGGVLHRQVFSRAGESGRPITLGDESAIIYRDALLQLQNWASEAAREMQLTLHDGRSWQVVYRHMDQPVLETQQAVVISDPGPGHWYKLLKLKLEVV